MRKDDHLIFEAFAQQSLLSDEQAAKMIADKIRGTPNLNINTIKQYVSKYLGMVGKAPTDVDYLAAHVHDILSQQGLAGENAEGLSDQEYHKARKDSFELPGEEIGNGPIKVRLNKDTRLDCYKSGTVQEVRFSKGTIFNCDENVGDYYECDTEEYGGIAVFPDDVTVLSGEENAEGPMIQTYIHLDLYTGKTSVIPSEEFQEAIDGLEKVKGKMTVYKGEEYMVLVVPGK